MLGIIFIVLPLISSFNASSTDYSVGSYHTGLAGQEPTSSFYDSTFTLTYQQASGDAESADYTVNLGWFSQEGYCGDGVCGSGETCLSCVADCACASGYSCVSGVCTADSVTTPSGGGADCTYDWVCSEWYPEPCPANGIQKRVCVNRGTCTGTVGIPDITRTCTSEVISPAEPLFDIFAKIPLKNKWVSPGDSVRIDIKLINVGNITTLDVFFKYWIVDENNKLISETQETRAIGEGEEFKKEFVLPDYLTPGIYKIYAQITYDADKIAMANDSFEVMRSRFALISRIALLFLLILSVIVILILIIIKQRKKKRKKTEKGLRDYKKRVRRAMERHKNKTTHNK